MILIQTQLCSIDQSDLFIAWRRGGKSIRHLRLPVSPPLHTLARCSLHVCLHHPRRAKCSLSNQVTPAGKAISACPARLILLLASMLCFSLHLFVLAPHLCPLPPRLASPGAGHPGHVKSQKRRQVTKERARLPCPSGPGAVIKANFPPPAGRSSRKRSETGKVKSVQGLNTFRRRICLDLAARLDTLHFLSDW